MLCPKCKGAMGVYVFGVGEKHAKGERFDGLSVTSVKKKRGVRTMVSREKRKQSPRYWLF